MSVLRSVKTSEARRKEEKEGHVPAMPSAGVYFVVAQSRLDESSVAVLIRTLSLSVARIVIIATTREAAMKMILALTTSMEGRSLGKSRGINAFWQSVQC